MKTSIVPAQITSIEDTVTAKLSLTQIILLILPVFVTAIIFAVLPPFFHLKIYKLVLAVITALPIMLLSVRIRGQLVLKWLNVLIAYRYRPRCYILAKVDPCACGLDMDELSDLQTEQVQSVAAPIKHLVLAPAEYLTLDEYLSHRQVSFTTDSKGRLNAVIEAE